MATGRHTEGNKRGITTILLVVALVVATVGVGWVLFRPDGTNAAGGCDGRRNVVVSVNDAIAPVMEQAIKALGEEECFPAQMRVESASDVEKSFFSGGRPDLWVADTSARVDRLSKLMISTSTVNQSLASTPVGLVGSEESIRHDSWIDALTANEVTYGDPGVDGAVALALMAPEMERDQTGAEQEVIDGVVVLAAQNFGQKAGRQVPEGASLVDDLQGEPQKVAPVTEQYYVNELSDRDDLVQRTPRTGAPMLTFPLVKANGGAPDTDVVGEKLGAWFASDSGQRAIADAGLRSSSGEPLDGRGFEDAADLGPVPADEFDVAIGRFTVLSVPSSLLAVFDVSGSMGREHQGRTRADFAADAALTALDAFPSQTRIGLWAFSIDQGGPGKDHIELAPMRRLDDETEGKKHEKFLAIQAETLRTRSRGGTGLYDTTLAAYKKALEEFDRSYVNSVILLTDGSNDDKGSISLASLLTKLEEMRDPNRAVRIISIGITADADMEALRKISAATGGQAYQAMEPDDIINVLVYAMRDR